MAFPAVLPPGFRFHPTDEELVAYYLQRKVTGRKMESNVIAEIDLYRHDPWELPALSCLPSKDSEWYFFNSPDKKYPRGLRTNRATKSGYWKATGKDRKVCSNSRTLAMKKTLVFHLGRAPSGARTDWVMHEYQLVQGDLQCQGSKDFNDALVLCRVIKKRGPRPSSRNHQEGALESGLDLARTLEHTRGFPSELDIQYSHGMGENPEKHQEHPEMLIKSRGTVVLASNPVRCGGSADDYAMSTGRFDLREDTKNFSSKGWAGDAYNLQSREVVEGAWFLNQADKEERSSLEMEQQQSSDQAAGEDQAIPNWNFYPRLADGSGRMNDFYY